MLSISSNFPSTPSRLSELMNNLRYLKSLSNRSEVEIEKIGFVTPLSVTPVAAVINQKKLVYNYKGKNSSYLKTIHFPTGIIGSDQITSGRTFLPIIRLGLENLGLEVIRLNLSRLHSIYLDLLRSNIIADQQFLELITNNTFGFLIGELFANIEEHSAAKNMYIFAQYWPRINVCEVCIIDDGKGVFGSLQDAGRDVNGHMDALKKVLETGLSATNEFGDIRRGTGIRNTISAITNNELNGEFLIMTGDAVFFQSADNEKFFGHLTNYKWQGTMLTLRISRPMTQFNLYNYVK